MDGKDSRVSEGGALAVRSERRASVVILWLSGVLDGATSALLERTRRRAADRAQRLSFRQGLHVGQRPLDLIRSIQPRARPAPRRALVTNQGNYFPLAMASTDVDHQRPRDRPWGTLDTRPGRAAGASDAPSLPSVARAAPRSA
jgi:hypothetical protein